MKKIAYASLAAATFYFALFVTIPLTPYVLAYLIGLYFVVEIVVALYILTKSEDTTKVQISTEELEAIRIAKEAKMDISKLIGSSMALHAARASLGLGDGDYKIIFVPSEEKELLAKIYEVINTQEEDCK